VCLNLIGPAAGLDSCRATGCAEVRRAITPTFISAAIHCFQYWRLGGMPQGLSLGALHAQ